MLFELAQDFGMGALFSLLCSLASTEAGVPAERPIRCFEVLAEIKSSWSTGKTVNSLLLKRTALSSHLSVEVCERVLRRCDANVDI